MVSGIIGPRFGGQGLSSLELLQVLVDRGYDVTLITLPDGFDATGFRVPSVPSWHHHVLSPPNLYNWVHRHAQPTWKKVLWHTVDSWNPGAYRMIGRLLRKTQPDAVVLSRMRGFSAAVMSAAGRVCPGRVLKVVNDYETMAPAATLTGMDGLKGLTFGIGTYCMIRRRATRHVNLVISPSRYTLAKHLDAGFFPRAKPRIIANTHGYTGAALCHLQRQRPNDGHAIRRFLYLGRLEPEKGVEWLCRVFAAFTREQTNVTLDVAGWGSLESSLRRRYGHEPRIRFHGRVTGARKTQRLLRADAMVVPSQWPEVFGIVCVEAFAHGIPVIASRTGGLPEVVSEPATGRLVQPGNDRSLMDALREFAAMPPATVCTMRRACNAAASRFTIEAFTAAYAAALDDLLRPSPDTDHEAAESLCGDGTS